MRGHRVLTLLLCSLVVAACSGRDDPAAARGKEAIRAFGCGSCHAIPGIRSANGQVGPPLDSLGKRSYIAGKLPNTPENVARWIEDPPAIEPQTAMPKVGVTSEQARDMAAYLTSLK